MELVSSKNRGWGRCLNSICLPQTGRRLCVVLCLIIMCWCVYVVEQERGTGSGLELEAVATIPVHSGKEEKS